jgi:Flp pilus assembly protein TadD
MSTRSLLRHQATSRVVALGASLGFIAAGCTPPKPPPPPPVLIAEPPIALDGAGSSKGETDVDRGVVLVQNERFAEGVQLIERGMAAGFGDAESAYYVAYGHERLGHRNEAENYYLKALQLEPTMVNARVNLAAIYLEEPLQPAKAIAVLEPAVASEPKSVDVRLNLAYAHRLEKNFAKAAEHYRAALAIEEKLETRQMLADVLFDAGDAKEVVVEMKKLLPSFTKNAKAMAAFGGRFAKVGAYTDCVSAFTKAIELEPRDANHYVNRGLCRHELGEPEASVAQDFEKATALDPKNQAALYYLGMSMIIVKKPGRALESFEKAVRLGGGTPFGKKAREKWEAMVNPR